MRWICLWNNVIAMPGGNLLVKLYVIIRFFNRPARPAGWAAKPADFIRNYGPRLNRVEAISGWAKICSCRVQLGRTGPKPNQVGPIFFIFPTKSAIPNFFFWNFFLLILIFYRQIDMALKRAGGFILFLIYFLIILNTVSFV